MGLYWLTGPGQLTDHQSMLRACLTPVLLQVYLAHWRETPVAVKILLSSGASNLGTSTCLACEGNL